MNVYYIYAIHGDTKLTEEVEDRVPGCVLTQKARHGHR